MNNAITARIPQNQPIVDHLLRMRRRRRSDPTKRSSYHPTGYANGACLYACEFAYYLGAVTVADYGLEIRDYATLDSYIEATDGVGSKVRRQIVKVLAGQQWGEDTD